LENAVYCGEAVFTKLQQGRTVATSWCPYHRSRYIQLPGAPRVRSEYRNRSYNGPAQLRAQFKKLLKPVKAVRAVKAVTPKPRAPLRTAACAVCSKTFETNRCTQYLCSEDCRKTDKYAKQNAAKADRRAKMAESKPAAPKPKPAAVEIMIISNCRFCLKLFEAPKPTFGSGRRVQLCSNECRRLTKNARSRMNAGIKAKASEPETVASTSDSS
jgi:predicted nucleic acid-binding Zn ribbon protein